MIKKRKFIKYILLNIITLGIYGIFFWYKWTNDLNKICDGDDKDSANYILVLLLDMFSFSIYCWVWNYQMGERMYHKAPEFGKKLKHGGMFIMIWRLLPLVSSYYKIKYINILAESYNSANSEQTEESAPVEESVKADAE